MGSFVGGRGIHVAPSQHPIDSSGMLGFGTGDVGGTVLARFMEPYWDPGLATVVAIQMRAPRAGILRNLVIRQNIPAVGVIVITYTVRVNGIATAIVATGASNLVDLQDLVNTVVVAQGDLIDIQITKAGAMGGDRPRDVTANIELD